MDLIRLVADVPPAPGTGAEGALRSAVLEASLFGLPASIPRAAWDTLQPWRDELLAEMAGEPVGVSLEGLDPQWRSTLSWAGIPFARHGKLRWPVDLRCDPGCDYPHIEAGVLILPDHDALAECSALGIKPVRTWIQRRFGVRLQAAAGLRLYIWPKHAVVISHLDIPVAGFLYGPDTGTRMGLTIHPGTCQVVSW